MSALGFYTYEHTRNDTGAVFYVGKGRGKRAGSTHGRNQYWKRVVGKAGGFGVRMIAEGVDEELAHFIEIERIDQCKRIGIRLANITDGGEGASGRVMSEASKQKLRDVRTGVPRDKATRQKLADANYGKKASEATRMKMSEAHKGKPKSEAMRKKLGDSRRGIPHPTATCNHCGKTGSVQNMSRWHFENCKQKEQ